MHILWIIIEPEKVNVNFINACKNKSDFKLIAARGKTQYSNLFIKIESNVTHKFEQIWLRAEKLYNELFSLTSDNRYTMIERTQKIKEFRSSLKPVSLSIEFKYIGTEDSNL